MPDRKPAKLKNQLRNRIVGSGMERVDQLLANPQNWRIHPDNQQQALAGAIDDIGFIRSVTVNKQTGTVVDGHLRVALALRSGVVELPVEYVDLTPDEEAKALLTLDPIAAMAAADRDKLDELLLHVHSDDERVQAAIDEIAGVYHGEYLQRSTETISQKRMIRILISLPINSALIGNEIIGLVSDIDGAEYDISGN